MLGEVFGVVWWLLSALLGWLFSPVTLGILGVAFAALYFFITKDYNYWPSKGVPGPKPTFPWGTAYGQPFLKSIRGFNEWVYAEQGGKNFCGFMEMHRPVLYVGNLDLIRCVTIKDFEHFSDRRTLVLNEDFDKVLTVLNGKEWKETRSIMSPAFSASKLRGMHQLCLDNAKNLSKYMREEMENKPEIELKDAFGRFTMDNIASCAFGVNCNSFTDPNSEFAKKAAKLFQPPGLYGAFRVMVGLVLGERVVSLLPDPAAPIARFFADVIRKTRSHREAVNEKRRDFLQLLLDTTDKEGNRALTDRSIMAQCVLFFIVGYDTTAALLTFCAYCLATEPQWQRRVQQDIDAVLAKHDGQLTYEAVAEMTVLDNVMSETLRLYPPGIAMERQCSKDYVIPGTEVKIERGTLVQMPIYALHHDPELFPDPEKFDPDRFLPEAKESRHPCAYIPFGSGPRNCIAMRFALFEAKVALIAVLMENSFEPGPSTPPPPMPLNDQAFLLGPKPGCGYVRVVPRE